MEFNIGDKVKLKTSTSGRPNSEFTVVTMSSSGKHLTIYSKDWADNEDGHSGATRDTGKLMADNYGHWNVDNNEIIHCTKIKALFSIGDTVEYNRQKFEIVAIDHEHTLPYTIYSRDWRLAQKGHDGKRAGFCGNGEVHGHYFMDEKNLKLINKNNNNEVFTKDQQGSPRGSEAGIHRKPIKLASSSRPVGNKATDFRLGIKLASGSISNNRVQSNKGC